MTGAGSPRRVGEVAERYKAALLGSAGTPRYLREAWFATAVDAWASSEAVCHLLRAWLDTQDIEAALTEFVEEDEDVSRPAPGAERRRSRGRRVASTLDALHKAESRASALRSKLGLDPSGYARISRDVAFTGPAQADAIERLGTKGRAIAAAAGRGKDPT